MNLGLEGTLVLGAMIGYATSYQTGSAWSGWCRRRRRLPVRAFHGEVCRFPEVNDIAIGIAMMLFGIGLAFFLGKPYIQPNAPQLNSISSAVDNRALRSALQVNPLFFVGVVLALLLPWAFRNTRCGLVIRTVGDSAPAARAMGFSVNLARFLATTFGGFLAGVGGAFLSLSYPGSWNQGLSSGQGLMAVALVIFARWNPLRCVRRRCSSAPPARSALAAIDRDHAGLLLLQRRPLHPDARHHDRHVNATHSARDMPGELSMAK